MQKKSTEIEVGIAEVVDYMRMTGGFAPALQNVVQRKVTADAARKSGIKISGKELQKASDTFRMINGMGKARDTEKWLSSNGLTLDAFEEYLETNLLINKFKDRLEKKTGKNKYMSSPGIKDSIKEMAYQDWMRNTLK